MNFKNSMANRDTQARIKSPETPQDRVRDRLETRNKKMNRAESCRQLGAPRWTRNSQAVCLKGHGRNVHLRPRDLATTTEWPKVTDGRESPGRESQEQRPRWL